MLDFQGGVCAICKRPMKKPNVDHRHLDGLIRGILCNICNRALGRFRDNILLLTNAITYLVTPPATEALGAPRFGLPGRVGTKKQRKMIRDRKKRELYR